MVVLIISFLLFPISVTSIIFSVIMSCFLFDPVMTKTLQSKVMFAAESVVYFGYFNVDSIVDAKYLRI